MTKAKSKFSLFCHFCETFQKDKSDMRLIYLTPNTTVKICLTCLQIYRQYTQNESRRFKMNSIETHIKQSKFNSYLLHELQRIASALERLARCEEKMIDFSCDDG
jgi:hypothetical protein